MRGGMRGMRGNRGGGAVPNSLGSAMSDMGRTWRRVKTESIDPTKEEQALTDISTMERDVAIAKTHIPDKVQALTGDAKDKAIADYHATMLALLRKFTDLEQAVLDKKGNDAKPLLTDIDKLQAEGHKKFRDGACVK